MYSILVLDSRKGSSRIASSSCKSDELHGAGDIVMDQNKNDPAKTQFVIKSNFH